MDSNYGHFVINCLVEHLNLALNREEALRTFRYHARHLPADTHEDYGSIVLLECSQEIAKKAGGVDQPAFNRICDRIAHRIAYGAKQAVRMRQSDSLNNPPSIESHQNRADNRDTIRSAMSKLDPTDRMIVDLKYADELTLDEIGEKLGISVWQVRKGLREAIRQLRKLLSDHNTSP